MPRWRPLLAPLCQVLSLLKLLLPEVASDQRVAVLVDAIGEVLAGHADLCAFPALQLPVIDKAPFLHHA